MLARTHARSETRGRHTPVSRGKGDSAAPTDPSTSGSHSPRLTAARRSPRPRSFQATLEPRLLADSPTPDATGDAHQGTSNASQARRNPIATARVRMMPARWCRYRSASHGVAKRDADGRRFEEARAARVHGSRWVGAEYVWGSIWGRRWRWLWYGVDGSLSDDARRANLAQETRRRNAWGIGNLTGRYRARAYIQVTHGCTRTIRNGGRSAGTSNFEAGLAWPAHCASVPACAARRANGCLLRLSAGLVFARGLGYPGSRLRLRCPDAVIASLRLRGCRKIHTDAFGRIRTCGRGPRQRMPGAERWDFSLIIAGFIAGSEGASPTPGSEAIAAMAALMLMRPRTYARAHLSRAKVKTETKAGRRGHALPGEDPSRTSGRSTGSWNFGVPGAEGFGGPRCTRGRRAIVRSAIDACVQALRDTICHPCLENSRLEKRAGAKNRSRSEPHLVHASALLFCLGPLHMLRTSRLRVRSKPMDYGVLAGAGALIRASSAGSTTCDGYIMGMHVCVGRLRCVEEAAASPGSASASSSPPPRVRSCYNGAAVLYRERATARRCSEFALLGVSSYALLPTGSTGSVGNEPAAFFRETASSHPIVLDAFSRDRSVSDPSGARASAPCQRVEMIINRQHLRAPTEGNVEASFEDLQDRKCAIPPGPDASLTRVPDRPFSERHLTSLVSDLCRDLGPRIPSTSPSVVPRKKYVPFAVVTTGSRAPEVLERRALCAGTFFSIAGVLLEGARMLSDRTSGDIVF
ncbi:hypothetical protein HETIRDRAFT_150244 [Heterobasidion irregulare TC 32-1]|uniref:Uncharacterized protein n=1 Tax=Heterobasidion irregulare (strain TC 32-1) TaxID=747525 RepID=W4KJ89_HETIT|nr:uncharacterized protein HETIRDRAFT_150244 [Heterobasidion irregulare TC 32-1]ETW85375.1 hypothetical protein HETIRDRAFT_150244 [Heterobasidion irregulare TC 32-1]